MNSLGSSLAFLAFLSTTATITITITTTTTVEAFVVPSPSLASTANANKALFSSPEPSRVKKAGGGVPIVRSGDRLSFWDPASEGMRGMDGDLSLDDRLALGASYALSSSKASTASPTSTYLTSNSNNEGGCIQSSPAVPELLHAAQCWLEDTEGNENEVPPAFCTPKNPTTATLLGRTRIIDNDAPGDIQHIVMKLPEGFRYVEGQSLSVIPPGIDPKSAAKGKEKPHKPRLYSIASTRYGDLLDGNTVSLCVRRAEYTDPETGLVDRTKKGVCSNFLCDAAPGTQIAVSGPVGKTMLLPSDPERDVIMVATGTGIAPFRGFLHRLYTEHTVARHLFGGRAWLILGVPTTGSLLYKAEFDAMQRQDARNSLRIDYAISREMSNAGGGKLYVQDVLAENAGELFQKLEEGAVIYFCGLKGMMPGILEALEKVAIARGIDWAASLKKYQSNHQWHVEVY
mmetsp:Transcript_9400/g.19747  ORF Transcript_9400/g.19747 Transcript_9400/m.19747 type:complete len:458 (-) Transcript_9400:284-1657(-)|eukprot:CAMPEP_0201128080 /NCGR_PEP_ID=MMETSP0850-20130426/32551_1 /ASSEMBLY_ACC=CAM_ASM_000622 /TAXON_ID=183588 /ORGANISM="Pseudo-nitzschia fraudulenta, Strain WWA7" /LENGTH=457 /DNA_ID=CAMNT_0047397139 /DNA_START=261 /DNA_END=1634 /DNA_ORIENTATION=-